MSNHTPGQWKCEGYVVYFPGLIGGFSLQHCPDAEATARRIVACVNACAGIPTERLEAGAADVLAYSMELKKQRDELLASMRQTLAMLRVTSHGPSAANKAEEMLHAAICSLGADHSPDAAKMVAHEGWQLVPVEPTIEMVQAATNSAVGFGTRAAYQAMLSAAPKPEGGAA